MKFKRKKIISLFSSSFLLFLMSFVLVYAEGTAYVLLERLPVIGNEVKAGEFGLYISNLFTLSLRLATVLAVLMISYGGFKYLTSESFTGTSDAKKIINNAVIGLFLLLASWLLLYTINPDLVENTFTIPTINTGESTSGGGGGGGY